FIVLQAAYRWPRVMPAVIGATVGLGIVAVTCAASVVAPDRAAPWLVAGLILLTLGCPAGLLDAVSREPEQARFNWSGVRKWLRLAAWFVYDPFAESKP